MEDEKWVLVKGEDKGHPFFMMVNDALKDFQYREDYPYCLVATIYLSDVQDHRLPTDSEAEVLNNIEDTLTNFICKEVEYIMVGRETYYGQREILVYIPGFNDFKSSIDALSVILNKERRVDLEYIKDSKWDKAKRYLGG